MVAGKSRICLPLFCLLVMPLWLLAGCRENGPGAAPTSPASPPAVELHYGSDSCLVDLRVDKTAITVAEQLHIWLRIRMPEEMEAKLELPAGWPGELRLTGRQESPPRLADDGQVEIVNTILLAPFLAGEYVVPPLAVRFFKSGGEPLLLTTDRVVIKVESLLGPDQAKEDIDDIAAPVALPRSVIDYWPFAATAALLIVCGLLLLKFIPRWRKKPLTQGLPPHAQAYQSLAQLLAEGLLARGEVQVFHDRVSAILRRYIEARFALRASERTTEEFLTDMRTTSILPPAHRQILQDFLTQCDLVKFARHQPAGSEVDHIVTLCRQFIEETEPDMDQVQRQKETRSWQ